MSFSSSTLIISFNINLYDSVKLLMKLLEYVGEYKILTVNLFSPLFKIKKAKSAFRSCFNSSTLYFKSSLFTTSLKRSCEYWNRIFEFKSYSLAKIRKGYRSYFITELIKFEEYLR